MKYRAQHPSRERAKVYGDPVYDPAIVWERIRCLRCGDVFNTPNRCAVRHCDLCRAWLELACNAHDTEWSAYAD